MTGRIRTIKPEWLEDERFNACSDAAIRLAMVFLSLVDDDGRVRISTKALGMAGWKWCDLIADKTEHARLAAAELAAARWIVPYRVGEYECWQIRTFAQHQKIDRRRPSRLPPPGVEPYDFDDHSSITRRQIDEHSSNGRDTSSIVKKSSDVADSTTCRDRSSSPRRHIATDMDQGSGNGSGVDVDPARSTDIGTHRMLASLTPTTDRAKDVVKIISDARVAAGGAPFKPAGYVDQEAVRTLTAWSSGFDDSDGMMRGVAFGFFEAKGPGASIRWMSEEDPGRWFREPRANGSTSDKKKTTKKLVDDLQHQVNLETDPYVRESIEKKLKAAKEELRSL